MTTAVNSEKDMLLRLLNQEGMFYVLSIKKWSAKSRINPVELNLPKKVNKKLLSLGNKHLMLKDHVREIDNVQANAYEILKSDKFSQPFFQMRFVPANKLNAIEMALTEAKARYFQVVDEFMALYPQNVEEMRNLWIEELEELYPDQFSLQQNILSRIMSSYPDGLKVRQKYTFEWLGIAFALPDTQMAASVTDIRKVEETNQIILKMQDKMTGQLEQMFQRDVTNLEEAIKDLCETTITTSENSPSGLHQRTVDKVRKDIQSLRDINYADVESVRLALDLLEDATSESASEIRKRDGVNDFRGTIENIKHGIEESLEEDKAETLRGFLQTGRRKIEDPFI